MRILTIALAAMLAVSVATAASAAKKKTAVRATMETFEQCEQLAIDRGVPHGQTGHSEFVEQCMGKPPRGRKPSS